MVKLFVAVDVSATAALELIRLQPPPGPGVRLVEPGQMHVTLHYLGETQIEPTSVALHAVAAPAFQMKLEGVGQFLSSESAGILYAGVCASPELLGLHTAVAAALAALGFRPEARPYVPHVTLARCTAEAPAGLAEEFLARHAGFALHGVLAAEFGLYASEASAYRCERSFPLRAVVSDAPA
jgi:RNA 2',3'-cyclic 3'-phosphodiesterase